ncbi:MAG: large subunit ribosomal protein [Patescibacteria group bacterium]|nr:large subunit ribosomal protein [Euryarchaeota archaeon]MDQ1282169.1 large subunit ribosomal protein [Patescibacteria group bacterium]
MSLPKYMKFAITEKQNMTQFFDEDGVVHPTTVLSFSPMVVTQIKTKEKNGYDAVQVACFPQKKERVSKSVLGHTKDAYKIVKEFRSESGDLQEGSTINLDIFKAGDIVTISGVSKGKGYQGVVKRHGFKGGWGQHGQKHSHREPGSIGGGGRAGGRVVKGKKMGGRMGSDRITQKNVVVLDVDAENNILLVKGAVPGKRGTVIEVIQK